MNTSLVKVKTSRRDFIKYMLMSSAVAAGVSFLGGTQITSKDKLYGSESSIYTPRVEKKNLLDNKFVKRFLLNR
jgi:hypothetical protein